MSSLSTNLAATKHGDKEQLWNSLWNYEQLCDECLFPSGQGIAPGRSLCQGVEPRRPQFLCYIHSIPLKLVMFTKIPSSWK